MMKIMMAAMMMPTGNDKSPAASPMRPVCWVTQSPELTRRESARAQNAKLSGSFQLQGHQRTQDAHKGHHDSQNAQHRSDRKGAVEHLERALAQLVVGNLPEPALRVPMKSEPPSRGDRGPFLPMRGARSLSAGRPAITAGRGHGRET